MSPRFLIDTDACIAFLDGADLKLRDRWLGTPSADLALCSVVKTELFRGAPTAATGRGHRVPLE